MSKGDGAAHSTSGINHGAYQNELEKKAEALEGYTCANCGTPVEPDKASRCGTDYYCSPECHKEDRHPVASADDRVGSDGQRSPHTGGDRS